MVKLDLVIVIIIIIIIATFTAPGVWKGQNPRL
jgi:type II secretory pathway pseudopilin PulG